MTDSIDDTQPHRSGDPGSAAGTDPGPAGTAPGAASTAPGAAGTAAGAAGTAPAPGSSPPLRANPDRPADSGWREPPWFPPRDRDRRPSAFALVSGLVLIAIGAYYFLDRTLGIALPPIQWSSVWPIILIVIGGLILVRSFQRKS